MRQEEPLQSTFDLDPGSYVFRIEQGESPMHLVREDGSIVELTGTGLEVVHVPRSETLTLHFRANGRTPSIKVEKVR